MPERIKCTAEYMCVGVGSNVKKIRGKLRMYSGAYGIIKILMFLCRLGINQIVPKIILFHERMSAMPAEDTAIYTHIYKTNLTKLPKHPSFSFLNIFCQCTFEMIK